MDSVMITSVLCIILAIATTCLAGTCQKISSCKCASDDGHEIDLSSLENGDNPRFAVSHDSYTYYYQPCSSLQNTEPDGCGSDATLCQKLDAFPAEYNCGNKASATFSGDVAAGNVVISYSAASADAVRTSNIHLICHHESSHIFDVKSIIEQGNTNYDFTLKTRLACLNGGGGISIGTILVIMLFNNKTIENLEIGKRNTCWNEVRFFVSAVMYLTGGILYGKFKRQATGSDMLPNKDFWVTVPGYVKTGIKFTKSGFKQDGSYSQF